MTQIGRSKSLFGLLALVALNLFLLSVQVRNSAGQTLLRTWGLRAFSPILLTSNSIASYTQGLLSRYFYFVGIEKRNRYLEEENWKLQTELHQLEAIRQQLDHDPDFELLRQAFGFHTLRAAVIWRNIPTYSDRLVINAGTRNGVRKDSAVLRPDGVVGRIVAPSEQTSEVELLIDASSAAGAIVGNDGLQGVVQGTGELTLKLNFVLATESVEIGEVVYTSGGEGIYPKGFPIGVVASCQPGTGVYWDIDVKPFVRFDRIQTVAVVVEEP